MLFGLDCRVRGSAKELCSWRILLDVRGDDTGEDLGEFDFDFPIANARATAGGGTKTELKPGDFRPPFAVRGETEGGGVGPSSASVGGNVIALGRPPFLFCLF